MMMNHIIALVIMIVTLGMIVLPSHATTIDELDATVSSLGGMMDDMSTMRVDPATGFIIDQWKRVRLFHGVNAVQKGPPLYTNTLHIRACIALHVLTYNIPCNRYSWPADLLNATRVAAYQSWGFNVIRLGTMWPGFEPVEGTWDDTYINKLSSIVDTLAASGIYSLLDMHQDCMSMKFGMEYDGMPRWWVDKSTPKHAFPW